MIDELHALVKEYDEKTNFIDTKTSTIMGTIRSYVRDEFNALNKEADELVKFVNENHRFFYVKDPNAIWKTNRVDATEFTSKNYDSIRVNNLVLKIDYIKMVVISIDLSVDYCYKMKVGFIHGKGRECKNTEPIRWNEKDIDYWVEKKLYVDCRREILEHTKKLLTEAVRSILQTQEMRARKIIDAVKDIAEKSVGK